jgi:hypothetical protein
MSKIPFNGKGAALCFNCAGLAIRSYENSSDQDVLNYLTKNNGILVKSGDERLKTVPHIVLWRWISSNSMNKKTQYEAHFHCVYFDPSSKNNMNKSGYNEVVNIACVNDAKPRMQETTTLNDKSVVASTRFITEYIFIIV